MLKVNKQQEPDFLLEYKKKYSPKSWTDYNKDDIRNKIKENILVIEQYEYCPYCEKRIYTNDNGHISFYFLMQPWIDLFTGLKNIMLYYIDMYLCLYKTIFLEK